MVDTVDVPDCVCVRARVSAEQEQLHQNQPSRIGFSCVQPNKIINDINPMENDNIFDVTENEGRARDGRNNATFWFRSNLHLIRFDITY